MADWKPCWRHWQCAGPCQAPRSCRAAGWATRCASARAQLSPSPLWHVISAGPIIQAALPAAAAAMLVSQQACCRPCWPQRTRPVVHARAHGCACVQLTANIMASKHLGHWMSVLTASSADLAPAALVRAGRHHVCMRQTLLLRSHISIHDKPLSACLLCAAVVCLQGDSGRCHGQPQKPAPAARSAAGMTSCCLS